MRVAPQPVFDKFAGGACAEGWNYILGTVPELATYVPEDECRNPQVNTAMGEVICPPVRRSAAMTATTTIADAVRRAARP